MNVGGLIVRMDLHEEIYSLYRNGLVAELVG